MQRYPPDLHDLYSEKCREGNSCLELTKRFFSYTVQCFSDLCWKIETLGNIWQIWHHDNRTTWQHDAVTKLLDNSYHIKVSKNDLSFTFSLYGIPYTYGGTLYVWHPSNIQSIVAVCYMEISNWRMNKLKINPLNIPCGDVSLEDATPTCFSTELHVALVLVQPVNHRCDQ